METKEKKLQTLKHHQDVVSMALTINDYRLAYLDSHYASEDALAISKFEINPEDAKKYIDLSEKLEKEAKGYLRKLGLSPEEESKIIPRKPAKGFQEFKGLDSVKDYLRKDVVEPWNNNTFHTRPKNGLFLFGPSGTGKAAFVQSIIHELNATGYVIFPFANYSIYNLTDVKAHMKQLFKMAEEKNDVVFLFDTPEFFFPKGDDEESRTTRKLFLKLLTKEMKRIHKKHFKILFIMSTDYPDKLCPEIVQDGLFDDFIQIHHPSRDTRRAMMVERFEGFKIESEELITRLVQTTHGFVNTELSRLIRQIKHMAELYTKKGETPVISQVIVDKVLSDFKAEENTASVESEQAFLKTLPATRDIVHGV